MTRLAINGPFNPLAERKHHVEVQSDWPINAGRWPREEGQRREVSRADHTYAVTFVILLSDPQGNFIGTVKVRSVIQLDPQTDTFSGPEQVIVTIGGNTVASLCGTVQAERISVELPECQ